MSKVKSNVPRGFTRFYALHLINEKAMTGKEIMEEAEKRSEGVWKPSPGLIYPLLGRLARDGLVEEGNNGKFRITPKGLGALEQQEQLKLVQKLGLSMFTAGKMLAEESMDRILHVTQSMKESISSSSSEFQDKFYSRYRAFLLSELEKLEKKKEWVTNPIDENTI
jgi:DNA-binding PadR family transcriptional regulator